MLNIKKNFKKSLSNLYYCFLKCKYDILYTLSKNELSYTKNDFLKIFELPNPFFIVLIPGSLHIFDLWMNYWPSKENIVLILNGLDSWELSWIRRRVKFPTITINQLVDHGRIIDLILDNYPNPFGMIDYDCFVHNASYFEKIKGITDKVLANSLFLRHDSMLNIDIPGTYFMFLNSKGLNAIRGKYRTSCRTSYYYQLSSKIKNQLRVLGINNNGNLFNDLSFFDTLHVITALGISEGQTVNFLEKFTSETQAFEDLIHIGGVSLPNKIISKYSLRGSFFWRKLLEIHPCEELRKHYWEMFGEKRAAQLIDDYPEKFERIDDKFIKVIEELMEAGFYF